MRTEPMRVRLVLTYTFVRGLSSQVYTLISFFLRFSDSDIQKLHFVDHL